VTTTFTLVILEGTALQSPKGRVRRIATVYMLQKAVELRLQIRYRQHTDRLHFLSRVFGLQKGLQLYMSLHYICPETKEKGIRINNLELRDASLGILITVIFLVG
jgi:hypothetical protein